MAEMDRELRVGDGWRYQCKSCGHKVGIDSALPKTCPRCGAGGWWGKWTTPGCRSDSFWDDETLNKSTPHPKEHPTPIMQQAFVGDSLSATPKLEDTDTPKTHNGPGRPEIALPTTLLDQLIDRGLSVRAISEKMKQAGIVVHYSTVSRRLTKRLQQNFLQEVKHGQNSRRDN